MHRKKLLLRTYFNRISSFMQNVFSAANLKKYFSFIWGWKQWHESGWRAKERCLTKPTLNSSLSIQDQSCGHLLLSPLFSQCLGIEREKKWSYKTQAHTSAPSSSTPVSITVTYLSSIWTRSTVLSMWDLVPGSLLQGTQRWIT